MIEIVCTRKEAVCVWLTMEQLFVLSEACDRAGWGAIVNGERIRGEVMLDMKSDIVEVRNEVYYEEVDN